MSDTLISPGIQFNVIDESFYNSGSAGTLPLFLIATETNKTSAVAGAGIAPMTVSTQAGKLFLATSQRDLIQNFGNPKFHNVQGTPIHGYELNEYGLWSAWSFLGIKNQAYILRADIDTSQLYPSTSAPVGAPLPGTYWFDIQNTMWGVFRANGGTNPGNAWVKTTVKVATINDVDISDVPLTGYGNNGDVAVVPWTSSNYFYEKLAGTWYQIGSTSWKTAHPTSINGTSTTANLVQNSSVVINTVEVIITQATPHIADLVSDILSASIPDITASVNGNGSIKITNTAGGNITIGNGTGTPLSLLGITAGTYNGISVSRTNGPSYPDGSVVGSIWIKGSKSNNGANWSIKYFNGATNLWVTLNAPFYQFDSTLLDGNLSKDVAALASIVSPLTGTLYIGYDITTGDQQIRRWSGTQWMGLIYEADAVAPSTAPAAGTNWYNTNFEVDIMVGNGLNWLGYRHYYPSTDPLGPQIDGSAPTTQSDGTTPLVDNDLWVDSSDLENYPAIYRWSTNDLRWYLIDNTDQTTPFGIVFADARTNSGPTFTGIANSGSYAFSSTATIDMNLSDYVEPDAPDPRTHPTGILLFNTRYSTYNVKTWKPNYFVNGNFDANTNYTNTPYTVGDINTYTFAPLDTAGVWVTASGNKTDGTPYMGRKAQRVMIVRALAAVVSNNQDIRSELVHFDLMAAPGYPELAPELNALNVDMKNIAFGVIDTPIRLPPEGAAIQNWINNAADVSSDGEDGFITHSPYLGVYYPWGLGVNTDGTEVMIPPSAIALVTIAYSDQVSYPWYAPAFFQRGLVTNANSVGYLSAEGEYTPTILNNGQRDVLYANSINPIAYIPHRGLVVYGQKTLNPLASALDRINVARLINYIVYNLDNDLKPFLGEPNILNTRLSAKHTVEGRLNSLVGLNGLYDYAAICDTSNNTPERIDRNELWIDIAIQPVKTVEFIIVPIRILNTQATTSF